MKEPLNELFEWQLGWLAGIIDGEGCITLRVQHIHNDFIGADVDVGMTDQLTIYTICQITGLGSVYLMSKNPRGRQVYRWHITSFGEVAIFLRKILPYLLTRRKQAALVLEVCERRLLGLGQSLEDEKAVAQIRELNKKWKVDEKGEIKSGD